MKNKLILSGSLVFHVLIQGSPWDYFPPKKPESPRKEESSKEKSSLEKFIDVVQFAVVFAPTVKGISQWTYHQIFPTPQAKAMQGQLAFEECLRTNADDTRNRFNIPGSCTEAAIVFALARAKVEQPDSHLPRTQDIIDRFNATDF